MKQLKFQPVKGTRDFYPEQMAFRNWLFSKMREVSQKFGYEEYEGPILEPLGLYAAKSGEELVSKQTYILEDRGGEKLALRPEMTPTLARMVAQKQNELPKPIRWFTIGPRFRYEQPQKGRFREFYQWDIDLLGSKAAEADAEILAIAAEFFKALGLTPNEIKIKVNNRQLLEQKLDLIEIQKDKIPEILRAIDKKDKMEPEAWYEWLEEIGLIKIQIQDLNGILNDKDFSRESESLTRIFSTLKDMGVSEYFEFDPSIVRGLEYYTGTVFEARDIDGEFRAISGGGRYDNLVEVVGGDPLPGVGFACGDAVIEEVLRKYGKTPTLSASPTKVLVTVFNEELFRDSIALARRLRETGVNTEIYLDFSAKLDKQLKYANDQKIPYVAIIGPEEAANGEVIIKDMEAKDQKKVRLEEIKKAIQ
ncbi:MAG: histidine--tRNA ligase [bacterium]|nr:histidine--tRNA ligase [bacterium]